MKVEQFNPNDIENRARPDGFVFNEMKKASQQESEHTKCGTPECCGECDTADKGDGEV